MRMSLFSELKRRNVFRVAIAYLALAWLLTEVAGTLFPVFGIPDWGVRFVVVVLALGFLPTLVFSWVYELTPEGLKREREVARKASITHRTARRLDLFTIGLIVVALAFLLADRVWLTPTLEDRSASPPEVGSDVAYTAGAEKAEPQFPPNSIAVLPFVNMSEDAGNEYFSDGISEEILNALAQVRELKVAGRTSSFAFKGQSDDLRRIGAALSVAHILEGSVRKSGSRLRITAQLIKVDDGYHLWSDSYDRELTDVFAIQDEIANAIVEQLKAQLLGKVESTAQLLGKVESTVATPRTNPEVYDLYLLAKQRMGERQRLSLESAAELLDKAIELDPEFAPAHARRGITWLLLSEDFYGTIPRIQAQTQARLVLDRALELDPDLDEALAGLGLYYRELPNRDGDTLAIEYLQKALTLNPNLSDASNWLSFAYRDTGEWRRALSVLERMLDRDPLYTLGALNAVVIYNSMGRQAESMALLERIRPYFSDFSLLKSIEAGVHFSLGQFAQGLPLAEEAVHLLPRPDHRMGLGLALNATHQYERSVVEGHEYYKVLALLSLGRSDEALGLAEGLHSTGVSAIPLLICLNASGRFEDLIAYVEGHWPDLDNLMEGFVRTWFQASAMINIALAYARTGDRQKSDEVMKHVRRILDKMVAEGLDHYQLSLDQAEYHVLVGDNEKALEHLAAAIDAGYIGPSRLAQERPALEPLEGHPSYEAIRARMLEHLGSERDKLGLEPLSP
jgi:TolB-like protein